MLNTTIIYISSALYVYSSLQLNSNSNMQKKKKKGLEDSPPTRVSCAPRMMAFGSKFDISDAGELKVLPLLSICVMCPCK